MEDSKRVRVSGGGIGFCGALTIAFIVLKLCKVIDWAWLWVLGPIWIPFAIGLAIMLIAIIISVVAYIINGL